MNQFDIPKKLKNAYHEYKNQYLIMIAWIGTKRYFEFSLLEEKEKICFYHAFADAHLNKKDILILFPNYPALKILDEKNHILNQKLNALRLPPYLIKTFNQYLNWNNISQYSNLTYEQIKKYSEKINFPKLLQNKNIETKTITKIASDIQSLYNNKINCNMSNNRFKNLEL